jgi:copper transport protein
LQPNRDLCDAIVLTGRRSGLIRAWSTAACVALTLVLFSYGIASAHATLVSSDPRAGTWVPTSPSQIRLVFSEPVEASLATITLISVSGQVRLPATGDPHDVHAVIGTPGSLVPAEYRVVWRIVSADGHPVSGSFVFGVGPSSAHADQPPNVVEIPGSKVWGPAVFGAPIIPALLRGAADGCILALTGLLWFAISAHRAAATRLPSIALKLAVAAPILCLAHLFGWLINTAPNHHLDAAWISASFGTTPGRAELARTLLSLVPIWALGLARRPAIALAGGCLAILGASAVGHSAAIVPEWAIPFKAIHLLALAIWSGGLVWILAGRADDAALDSRQISRVSSTAFWAVFAVAFSGVVQARVLMSSWSDFASVYGAVIIAKVVGLAVLVGFGAYHRRLIGEFVADKGSVAFLRKSVAREILVFAIVVLLGGFLAYLSPPMERPSAQSNVSLQR